MMLTLFSGSKNRQSTTSFPALVNATKTGKYSELDQTKPSLRLFLKWLGKRHLLSLRSWTSRSLMSGAGEGQPHGPVTEKSLLENKAGTEENKPKRGARK